MAFYKYSQRVKQDNHEVFDETYTPGTDAPYPGIYRCASCGDEIAIARGKPLPPQNHRQHDPSAGAIRWQLIVFAVQQD